MVKLNKIKGVTHYSGIAGIYLTSALRYLVRIGNLNKDGLLVLDYGCGHGLIKKICTKAHVTNFDILPELSDISDWRDADFEVIAANHVFYTHSAEQLEAFCIEVLKISQKKNRAIKIVSGHSMNTFLNTIGKVLLNRMDAHDSTQLSWEEIDRILSRHFEKKIHRTFFFLSNVLIHEAKAQQHFE